MADESEIVASFQKNSQEEFRFSIAQFNGRAYADIRIFYEKDGTFLPSKKGITVAPDTWKEFRAAIEKLETVFQERKILVPEQE